MSGEDDFVDAEFAARVAEHDRPEDRVLELADIPRPIVAQKLFE